MANKVEFVRVTDELLQVIAADMRQPDVDEVWASNRLRPLQALRESVRMSDFCAVTLINDEPCVVYGLRKGCPLSGAGVPWMLGCNAVYKYKRELFLQTPAVILEMNEICPLLINHVHAENKLSIDWLKWLGFEIEDAVPNPMTGELFHKFTMVK